MERAEKENRGEAMLLRGVTDQRIDSGGNNRRLLGLGPRS
jgi:hypothetical protein